MKYVKQLLEIPPSKIRRNSKNPRIHFTEVEKQRLIESIDLEGILVPVSVYLEDDNSDFYILLDGERRWRCATELALPTIPALVEERPDPTQNLLKMFQIHMVREEWTDMATAWAVEDLMGKTGKTSAKELAKLTGLSVERLERMLLALKLPKELQDKIDSGEIPMNFFFEAQQNLVSPLQRADPELYNEYGQQKLIDIIVKKRESGAVRDTVELRNMRPIVNSIRKNVLEETRETAVQSLREFLDVEDRTIGETYDDTVGLVVEVSRFAKQCEQLAKKAEILFRDAVGDERSSVLEAVNVLIGRLSGMVSE